MQRGSNRRSYDEVISVNNIGAFKAYVKNVENRLWNLQEDNRNLASNYQLIAQDKDSKAITVSLPTTAKKVKDLPQFDDFNDVADLNKIKNQYIIMFNVYSNLLEGKDEEAILSPYNNLVTSFLEVKKFGDSEDTAKIDQIIELTNDMIIHSIVFAAYISPGDRQYASACQNYDEQLTGYQREIDKLIPKPSLLMLGCKIAAFAFIGLLLGPIAGLYYAPKEAAKHFQEEVNAKNVAKAALIITAFPFVGMYKLAESLIKPTLDKKARMENVSEKIGIFVKSRGRQGKIKDSQEENKKNNNNDPFDFF